MILLPHNENFVLHVIVSHPFVIKCCLKTSWGVVVFLLLTFIDQSKINNYLWLRNPLMLKLKVYLNYLCLLLLVKSWHYLKYIMNRSSKMIIFPFLVIVEGYMVVDNLFE